MEKKLKNLLDYQRFAKNERLEGMTRAALERLPRELNDEDLSLVAAAGQEVYEPEKKKTDG